MRRVTSSILLLALSATAARADDPAGSTTVRAAPDPDGAVVTHLSPDDYAGQLLSVGDVVSDAPGVAVLDYGGMLATTTVSIRGATSDEVQVILDGVPLNATAGGGFDLSLIPAALVDSIDVRRGSEGQEYGAGAMGGAVVLQPVSRDRVLLTAGSLGTYGASGSFTAAASAWRFLFAEDIRHTDGDFAYQRPVTPEIASSEQLTFTRQNNDATIGSLLLRAERPFDSGAKLSALLWAAGIDRGIPWAIWSSPTDARQHEATGLADVRLDTPTGGRGHLELPVSVRGDLYDAINMLAPSEDGVQHTIDASTRPAYTLPLGAWTLRLSGLAGYETLTGPELGFHDRLRGAIGGDATWEHGRWSAFVGVREEKWGPAAAFLPRAGGTVRVIPMLTVAASAGLGFRPPSFGELYYSAGPILANPELKPERSDSGDVSLRLRKGGVWGAVTGFGGWYQDTIVYAPYYAGVKPLNVGNARCLGGELELHWRPPVLPLRGLELSVAYTHSEAVDLDPQPTSYGKLLPYRPEDRGNVRASYEQDQWRVAIELQFTGAAYADQADTESVEAFTDLRASAGLRLWRSFWLSGEVRNALNEIDRMVISEYPLPGRVFLAHLSWEPEDGARF